jgi:hypothetical protein
MNPLYAFARGALMIGFAVIALFFAKFWRRSQDRLFAFFALSFALLALNQIGFILLHDHDEKWIYVLRVIAFGLIIAGIVDKNRRTS